MEAGVEIKQRIRPTRKWLAWTGLVTVVALIITGTSLYLLGPDHAPEQGSASIRVRAQADEGTVGGTPVTEKYNETLKEHNEKGFEEALANKESYVPTVVGENLKRPNVKKIEPPKAPEPPPLKTNRKNRQEPSIKEEKNKSDNTEQLKKNMEADLTLILNEGIEKYQPHKTILFYDSLSTDDNPNHINKSETDSEKPPSPPLPFKMGDILYSANIISINSDVPSPVVAQVVSGAFKKTKFSGRFTRHEKYLLLRFDEMSTPSGDTYKVDAIALDPFTGSAAVRSRVDSHYLERWGGLIAGSFLEGFGESVEKSGTSFRDTDTSETIAYPEYDVSEQAWIAAGVVGKRLANIAEKGFDRPPTVYEQIGEMFAIMILSIDRG
jgi:type IV secretory pathway VirB10-like protein